MPLNSRNVTYTKIAALSALTCATLVLSNPSFADSAYGPVKSNDTLSKILKRLYTGSKSSQLPMMKQIVKANPSSFLNGNMNLLKLNSTLVLPGNSWNNVSQNSFAKNTATKKNVIITDVVDRTATSLTVEQMKGRIVFLDAERSSLIEEVGNLKRETQRLEQKILKLEAGSKESDEQLRILDAEIIRLTEVMKGNESKLTNTDLNQLVVLQEKLRLVQEETNTLRTELANTKNTLSENGINSKQANQTIALLTEENQTLQKLLKDTQPGVNFYNDSTNESNISLLSGKLQLPVGIAVVGGTLLVLMLTTLVATRRKKKSLTDLPKETGIDPFDENNSFSNLLETENYEGRLDAQADNQPEENVFKMFDEGTLEMDLKLDMAEAYLEVSDFTSAKSILEEVIQGGSELQKRKANRLIKKAA
jgi:FimV-like protein